MSTLQDDGRLALAESVVAQPVYLAWGRGKPAWDATPEPEPSDATALIDEVGRRRATHVGYCKPVTDPALPAEIELPGNARYTASPTPTPWVYVRVVFAFNEAEGETLREFGLFLNSQPKAGLPAGQRYFTPDQIEKPGRLYMVDRLQAFTRSGHVRNTFEYVLPF